MNYFDQEMNYFQLNEHSSKKIHCLKFSENTAVRRSDLSRVWQKAGNVLHYAIV